MWRGGENSRNDSCPRFPPQTHFFGKTMTMKPPTAPPYPSCLLGKMSALFCAALLTLPGCAAFDRRYQTTDTPPAGHSLVYFYRSLATSGNGPDPRISQGGKEILATLPQKTYWVYAIPPGTHTFNASFSMHGSGSLTIANEHEEDIFFVEVRYEYGAPDRFKLYLAGRGENSEPKALEGCFRVEQ